MMEHRIPPCAWATRCLELAETGQTTVVVVPEESDLDALVADIKLLAPARSVMRYEDDEQSPYSPLSPDPRRGWGRLGLLAHLAMGDDLDIVVTTATALGRRVPDITSVAEASLLLTVGETIDREELTASLEAAGYHRVPMVEDEGTVALRGSVVDLWPPGERQPVRADFFGDELESLRVFDPTTQRRGRDLELLVVAPAKAFSVGPEIAAAKRPALLALSDELELPSEDYLRSWQRIEAGIRYPGVEALEPLLRSGNTSLLELLPRGSRLIRCHPRGIEQVLIDNDRQLLEGFAERCDNELVAPPSAHRLDADKVRLQLARMTRIDLDPGQGDQDDQPRFADLDDLGRDMAVARRRALRDDGDHLQPITEALKAWRRDHLVTVIVGDSPARLRRIAEGLEGRGLHVKTHEVPRSLGPGVNLAPLRDSGLHAHTMVGKLQRGLVDRQRHLVLLPERLISGQHQARRGQRPNQFNTTLAELRPGRPVVHLDYGIGRYEGIERRSIDGIEHDFIRIDFRGDDKVFVPVARIGVLRPYDGGDEPKLDKIGGTAWQKRCARVRQGLLQIAHRLVETQARRESFDVTPMPGGGELSQQFEDLFPFQPTPDQDEAFGAVAQDMASPVPMDRLICGDVGFGKTEVAMRAAFTAVAAGTQVAVLVPTTVLCQQHLRAFTARFEAVGARVAGLSRLQSIAETKQALADLASGAVDVVVGTHKLLGRSVAFKNLGLLIVDEEQRFGVRHKERIKELCDGVNVLTMTATPIPRTLQLSMLGVRKLSTIATPPASRRAVRTAVCRYEDELVREAALREFERGGQVFFLHNRVEDVESVAANLQRLIPEAVVDIAHGQMTPERADAAMIRFINGETNLLVCTTIIESGLDIPNANTILVNRADRFGLAQLHQIRGRVGRRRERGFCYLLLRQDEDHLTEKARLRLEALRRFSELGSGLRIAREDLDIRGAGNLIGADQSGHIEAIGIDLYSELLREAIARVKGGQINTLANVDVRVGRSAFIPRNFMPDAAERISLYDRLARANEDTPIIQLAEELEDRYGRLTDEVEALFLAARARWRAGAAGVSELIARPNGDGVMLVASFEAGGRTLDPAQLVRWVSERPSEARLTASGRLIWEPTKKLVEDHDKNPARLTLRFAEELKGLAS